MHDVFYKGENICGQEFFWPEGLVRDGEARLAPEWYIREHLDAFFKLYETAGFRKKLRCFVSPAGAGDAWKTPELATILRDYGIQYWCNAGIVHSIVQAGILINLKTRPLAPWEAYDLDPDALEPFSPEEAGLISGHWPNVLRFNPKKNLENLDAWERYFDRHAEIFGIILARDIEFAEYQQFYRSHCAVTETEGRIVIDLSAADAQETLGPRQPLYISVRSGAAPQLLSGGALSLYETHGTFSSYRIERTDDPRIAFRLV